MARRYWGQRSAVGGRVMLDSVWHDVVGVVADVRHRGAGMRGRHRADVTRIYLSYAAGSRKRGNMAVVARTVGEPTDLAPQIRRVMTLLDPNVALFNVRPLEDVLWDAVSEPRFRTWLLGAFGIASLILAVVGVYGVMAYAVVQRTRELGIRKALGADRTRIVRYVVGRGLVITALGVGTGLAAALVVAGVLRSYLYNVAPRDPTTMVTATAVLATAALTACLLPALRAARVDPLIALRAE